MGLFQHPHLIRGIVHTSKGSFAINRGLVDVPDEVGESYGWLRLELDDAKRAGPAPGSSVDPVTVIGAAIISPAG